MGKSKVRCARCSRIIRKEEDVFVVKDQMLDAKCYSDTQPSWVDSLREAELVDILLSAGSKRLEDFYVTVIRERTYKFSFLVTPDLITDRLLSIRTNKKEILDALEKISPLSSS